MIPWIIFSIFFTYTVIFNYPLEQKINIRQKQIAERYVTHIGEKCLDKCDNHGEDYNWCNTGTGLTGWDYCSQKSGNTTS